MYQCLDEWAAFEKNMDDGKADLSGSEDADHTPVAENTDSLQSCIQESVDEPEGERCNEAS